MKQDTFLNPEYVKQLEDLQSKVNPKPSVDEIERLKQERLDGRKRSFQTSITRREDGVLVITDIRELDKNDKTN